MAGRTWGSGKEGLTSDPLALNPWMTPPARLQLPWPNPRLMLPAARRGIRSCLIKGTRAG